MRWQYSIVASTVAEMQKMMGFVSASHVLRAVHLGLPLRVKLI